jgi:hypothetical protein
MSEVRRAGVVSPFASAVSGALRCDRANEALVSGRQRDVIVVLQDGRQLDGWMRPFERVFACGHAVRSFGRSRLVFRDDRAK